MDLHPDATVNPHPHYIYFGFTGMWFQVEEVLEKIKMGFDPQKSFTEMNKNGNTKNRIWGQVMYLNPPVMQKTSEEIRSGDSEAAKNMRLKNHSFIRFLTRNRIPPKISANELLLAAEADSPLQDQEDGSQSTYLLSTPRLLLGQQHRSLSPSPGSSW